MARAPKHRRIKRATVLIKRTRCIRNTKKKSYSPLFHKLKVNNHSLARALSQEKQESQLLFSRNVELLAEVQDLVHACNNRDLVITNVLKNSKDMMQMLVTMSGYLTNTISACQEFVSNQVNIHRTSSSSTGRRESSRRLSTKSPARGVVKPMVSGHTITKPTINLSRVNMQRLQNANLSIIEEGPSSPERTLDRSVENRRSRIMPERLPVSGLRNEDDEDRVIVNRRTSKYSAGRLSSGRYSKRNSGRLSGSGVAGRLSKRSSDYSELLKSPRVTLQDVSRYLINSQTVNIRMLSESANGSQSSNAMSIDDTQALEDQSSPDNSSHAVVIPETQDACDISESEERDSSNAASLRKSITTSKRSLRKKPKSRSPVIDSQYIDPLEGSSWMHNSSINTEEDQELNTATLVSAEDLTEEEHDRINSPVSSLPAERRRTSNYFRVPELPKSFKSANMSNGFLDNDNDDEDDHRIKLCYITQRRGLSSKMHSTSRNDDDDDDDDDDDVDVDDDDETLMLNVRRHLNQLPTRQSEQPERLQFDVNELLQLTPLKPLLSMSSRINNGSAQVDVELEPTATIQITQRCPKPAESTDTFSQMLTMKIHQNGPPELPTVVPSRNQEQPSNSGQDRRISEMTTMRLSSRIELPRLTDVIDTPEDNEHRINTTVTPENEKHIEKRKRIALRPITPSYFASDNSGRESPIRKRKIKQRKKKSNDKDPSTAKVVLQKLNDTHRGSSQDDTTVSLERKNPDELIPSTKNSMLSRADHSGDSESSTASCNGKSTIMRPRRQKAPKNLQEPNLNKKLRR
ncbi:PREDICTED: uncharacterized protein LOC105364474 [Ceratosolen solmsi marchali]|uniref:Uncharacterized protein LOC105364474 n=1 Tax=Ceratosolen solmsi marchali TaxID=326594 RepID=A0AAJ6YMB5_9HYME|nr:PREDICTED: uncharacterized protein LOC105364474 [Ceratosolen solmsi marchali]